MSASSSTPSSGPAPVFPNPASDISASPSNTSDPLPPPPPPIPFSTPAPSPSTSPPCHPSSLPFPPTQPRSRVRSRTPPLSLRSAQLNASVIPQQTRRRLRLRRTHANSPIAAASRLAHSDPAPPISNWSLPRPPPPSAPLPDHLPNTSPHISPTPSVPHPALRQPSSLPQPNPNPNPVHLPPPLPSQPSLTPPQPDAHRSMYSNAFSHPLPNTSQPSSATHHRPPRSTAIDELIAVLEGRVPHPHHPNRVISRTHPHMSSSPAASSAHAHRVATAVASARASRAPSSFIPPVLPHQHTPRIPITSLPPPTTSTHLAPVPPTSALRPSSQPFSTMLPTQPPMPPPSERRGSPRRPFPPSMYVSAVPSPLPSAVPPRMAPSVVARNSGQPLPIGDRLSNPRLMWPSMARQASLAESAMTREPPLPPLASAPVSRPINPFRQSVRPSGSQHRLPHANPVRAGPSSSASRLPSFVAPTSTAMNLEDQLGAAFASNVSGAPPPPGTHVIEVDSEDEEEDAVSVLSPLTSARFTPGTSRFAYTTPTVARGGHAASASGHGASGHGAIPRRAVSFSVGGADDAQDAGHGRGEGGPVSRLPAAPASSEHDRSANMSRFLRLATMASRHTQVSDDMRVIFGDDEPGFSAVGPTAAMGETGVSVGDRNAHVNLGRNLSEAAVRRFMLADDDSDVAMGEHAIEGYYFHPMPTSARGRRGARDGYGFSARGRSGLRAMGRMPRSPGESMLRRSEVRAMVAGREFGVPCGLFEYSVRGRPSLTPGIEWPEVVLISDENLKPRGPILDIMSEGNVQWCVRVGPLGNGEGDGRRGYLGFVHGLIEGGFAIELHVQGGCIYLWALTFPPYGECLLGVFRPNASASAPTPAPAPAPAVALARPTATNAPVDPVSAP